MLNYLSRSFHFTSWRSHSLTWPPSFSFISTNSSRRTPALPIDLVLVPLPRPDSMTSKSHPSFVQSLIVCLNGHLTKVQLTKKRIGRRSSGNVGRLVVFPNRYPQDSSPVRTRVHQGWWIQRRVPRCGQRRSGQRSGRYVCRSLVGSSLYGSHVAEFPAAAFFTTYDTLKKTIPTRPGWEAATHMMAASCGEIVRPPYSSLPHSALSERPGRVFGTRSDRSDQVAHANGCVWSPRRLITLCTDYLREGRSGGVLPRVWYNDHARSLSPRPIRTFHANPTIV